MKFCAIVLIMCSLQSAILFSSQKQTSSWANVDAQETPSRHSAPGAVTLSSYSSALCDGQSDSSFDLPYPGSNISLLAEVQYPQASPDTISTIPVTDPDDTDIWLERTRFTAP